MAWPAITAMTLLAACGEAGGASAPGDDDGFSDLQGRTFLSTALDDHAEQPLKPGSTVTMSFAKGEVSGSAGCNRLFAKASLADSRLVVDDIGQTDMGCPGRQFHDQWLADLLTSRPTVMLDGDRLTLTSGDTVVALQDEETADPDRPLVGTSWTLEAIEDGAGAVGTVLGSVPAGVTSRLRFRDDGVLAVWPGCNRAGGDYSVDGDSVVLGELVATAMDCAEPVMEVESAVLDVLHGTLTFTIDGSRLRLTGGDRTLVYRTG